MSRRWGETIVRLDWLASADYLDGRRDLSVIFSRRTRALMREAFFVTDDYRAANQILGF